MRAPYLGASRLERDLALLPFEGGVRGRVRDGRQPDVLPQEVKGLLADCHVAFVDRHGLALPVCYFDALGVQSVQDAQSSAVMAVPSDKVHLPFSHVTVSFVPSFFSTSIVPDFLFLM